MNREVEVQGEEWLAQKMVWFPKCSPGPNFFFLISSKGGSQVNRNDFMSGPSHQWLGGLLEFHPGCTVCNSVTESSATGVSRKYKQALSALSKDPRNPSKQCLLWLGKPPRFVPLSTFEPSWVRRPIALCEIQKWQEAEELHSRFQSARLLHLIRVQRGLGGEVGGMPLPRTLGAEAHLDSACSQRDGPFFPVGRFRAPTLTEHIQ